MHLQSFVSYGLRLQGTHQFSCLSTSESVYDTSAVCGHLSLVAAADVSAALVHLESPWAECAEDDLREHLLLAFIHVKELYPFGSFDSIVVQIRSRRVFRFFHRILGERSCLVATLPNRGRSVLANTGFTIIPCARSAKHD